MALRLIEVVLPQDEAQDLWSHVEAEERGGPAVIIGAMVIAPLLGPNVALALATTLGDTKLIRRSLLSNVAGMALALAIATGIGLLLPVGDLPGEIRLRTTVHWSDIVLALAAGGAGSLALTTGVPTTLVGVMVAVALLPPMAVLGLMTGTGRWPEAAASGLLLATNLICVNLAATLAFRIQGIRPRTWWEEDRARRASRIALWIGGALLVALGVLIALTQSPLET